MSPSFAVVGAGFSGLCIAAKLKLGGFDNFTIFDQYEDVGGVWKANTYPGCASDIPTHLYSLSFCPNPTWSEFFCRQEEIQKYASNVAEKYDLYRHSRFQVQVVKLEWLELDNVWELSTRQVHTFEERVYRFDMVFMCVGTLRLPNIPEQFRNFKGPMMHSAEWNSDIEIRSKKVGIVGSGASAIQIIPAIAKDVEQLTIFQRRPSWIFPRTQLNIPQFIQTLFWLIPAIQWLLRICIFWFVEATYLGYIKDSIMNSFLSKLGRTYLKRSIKGDECLRQDLEPKYSVGCKRPAFHSEYYETMNRSNVNLVASSIVEVKKHSVVTEDGKETPIDVLILATGFRVHDYYLPMQVSGINGQKPIEKWISDGPSNYRGIITNALPNLFFICGPNALPGHASVFFVMECQANWCLKVIKEMQNNNFKVVSVKESAEKDHMNKLLEKAKDTVWAQDCGNWFTNKHGVVSSINPISSVQYWSQTKNVDFSALNFQ